MTDHTAEKLIESREKTHGEFLDNANMTWDLMDICMQSRNWPTLPQHMKHAVYMTMHKMSRMLGGDPFEVDHWADNAGYSTLIVQRLKDESIKPYKATGIYETLARGWNCSVEEAKRRAPPPKRAVPEVQKPGSPEDGGHHDSETAAMDGFVRAKYGQAGESDQDIADRISRSIIENGVIEVKNPFFKEVDNGGATPV